MRHAVVAAAILLVALAGCSADAPPAPSSRDDWRAPSSASSSSGTSPPTSTASSNPSAAGSDPSPIASNSTAPGGPSNGTASPATPPHHDWPDPATATIYPGTWIQVGEGSINTCSTGFVFLDERGDVFLSTASHCVTVDLGSQADGTYCDAAPPNPEDYTVGIAGGHYPATVEFASHIAMAAEGTLDGYSCSNNDFALLRIDPRDWANVTPAAQGYGGPVGIAQPADLEPFTPVYSYAYAGGALDGANPGHPKYGYVSDCALLLCPAENHTWVTHVQLYPSNVPGDSGAFVITDDGKAIGVIYGFQPVGVGQNVVVSSYFATVPYAEQHLGRRLFLATWDFGPFPG